MDRVTAIGDRGAPGQGRGGSTLMRGDAHRQAQAEAAAAARHSIDAVDDITTVLGMPDGALPPPVQARIVALMEEVERLRNELAQARRHEAMLRELADHHPILPVAHRRTFLRDLTRLLTQSERGGLPGTVIVLHLAGIEPLRETHGPEAAEAALNKAIEVLRAETDQGDAIAYLDGGDFVVALAMVGEPEAQVRAQRLADKLANMPFLWNGMRPAFPVSWSRIPFAAGEGAEALLRAADTARRTGQARRPS